MKRFLLIDISNSFTKVAVAHGEKIGRVHRLTTPTLAAQDLQKIASSKVFDGVILSSVVPSKNKVVLKTFPQACDRSESRSRCWH